MIWFYGGIAWKQISPNLFTVYTHCSDKLILKNIREMLVAEFLSLTKTKTIKNTYSLHCQTD